jgi:hypothetical protein
MHLRVAFLVALVVWFVNPTPSAVGAPVRMNTFGTIEQVGSAPQAGPPTIATPKQVSGQQPVAAAPASTVLVQLVGTAVVRGRVTDETGTPIRGARVQTTRRDRFATQVTHTDAGGRYELRGLPKMSLTIAASLPGYTSRREGFGVLHVATLKDGEVREGVDFVLVRGGVVTGRVSDPEGGSLIGATVRAVPKRRMPTMGQLPSPGLSDTADDRGLYRLHGLPPGDYYLSVQPPPIPDWPQPAEADMTRGFAQVFYPGAPDAASAQCVAVASGAETAADVTVSVVPLFAITGKVLDRDGRPTPRAFLNLRSRQPRGFETLAVTRSAAPGPDGTFRLAGVAPGSYTLVANERSDAAPQPAARRAMREMDLDVSGDVKNLALRLSNGTTLTGRVVFATPPPKDVTSLQIYHRPTTMTSPGWVMPPVTLGPNGSFEFTGLRGVVEFVVMFAPAAGPNSPAVLLQATASAPLSSIEPATGAQEERTTAPVTSAAATPTYRMVAGVPVRISWRVRALRVAGRDVTDEGIDLGQEEGAVSGVEVEVADDQPVVTGIVRDEQGRPYPGARLVAIATDPRAARTPEGIVWPRGLSIQDGRYFVVGLAPGTWHLIALADIADPATIEDDADGIARLRARATRVTLAGSQVLELDLGVVRRP